MDTMSLCRRSGHFIDIVLIYNVFSWRLIFLPGGDASTGFETMLGQKCGEMLAFSSTNDTRGGRRKK